MPRAERRRLAARAGGAGRVGAAAGAAHGVPRRAVVLLRPHDGGRPQLPVGHVRGEARAAHRHRAAVGPCRRAGPPHVPSSFPLAGTPPVGWHGGGECGRARPAAAAAPRHGGAALQMGRRGVGGRFAARANAVAGGGGRRGEPIRASTSVGR